MISQTDINSILSGIIHPETNQNIVELQMVESLNISDEKISFVIKTKKPRDPFAPSIKKRAEMAIESAYPQYKDKISIIIREPAPKEKVQKPKNEQITNENSSIKQIIAVASGKGGVGKSTVTSNLAVMLAKAGYKVALIDADIYGPSQPKMFGCEDFAPTMEEVNGEEKIIPAERYGVKIMSIGFFIKPDDALVWRGPMATNALRQMIHQTYWGEEIDFMLVDLPPGTGDVHLTLITELKFNGAIIVSTPQKVALADVVRGIAMFKAPNVNIPVLGLVENMAWFTPAELPENRYFIFGENGGVNLAKEQGIELLAQIPIVQSICESGDGGEPESLHNKMIEDAYMGLIEKIK